jgi:hypothetical protein
MPDDFTCQGKSAATQWVNSVFVSSLQTAKEFSKLNFYYYSQFHETLTTNVPNFVGKFASSLRSSQVHIGIHKPICKKVPRCVVYKLVCESHYELLKVFGTFVVKVIIKMLPNM